MFQKILSATAALVAVGFISPAFAEEGTGVYVGLEGGMAMTSTAKFDVNATPVVKNGIKAKQKAGYDIGAFLGYDFGPVRAELEYSRISNRVSRIDTTALVPTKFFVSVPGTPTPVPTTAKGAFPDATGKTSTRTIMANVMADLGPADSLHAFVGAGIGSINVKAKRYSVAKGADFLDDEDSGLAWQLFAGVRAPLSEGVEVGVKYRYLNGSGIDMVDTLNRKVSSKHVSHGVLGNVAFKF